MCNKLEGSSTMENTKTIDTTECESHEFEFISFCGSFCKTCGIGYGVECLHPECKVHYCKKHGLGYPSVNNSNTFATVVEDMNEDIYVLSLGHDGVINGKDEDIHKVFSYPNLKIVEYCGYYTDENIGEIMDKYSNINFVPIW